MILFVDTSALIKRYILEDGTNEFQDLFLKAERVIVSVITIAEIYSTFSRLLREGEITQKETEKLVEHFHEDWKSLGILNCDQIVESKIKEVGITSSLRGADLIQLASALVCKDELPNISFIVADTRLANAGNDFGLTVINPLRFKS